MALTFIQHMLEMAPSSQSNFEDIKQRTISELRNFTQALSDELDNLEAGTRDQYDIDQYDDMLGQSMKLINTLDPSNDNGVFDEEMEQKQPGIRDNLAGFDAEPKEDENNKPNINRNGQRSARSLRRRFGQGGQRTNSQPYGEQEEEMNQYSIKTGVKAPANRERLKAINKWANEDGTPNKKRFNQSNDRLSRRIWGDEEEEQKMPAERDSSRTRSRMFKHTENVYKKPELDNDSMKHASKRSGQAYRRLRRST